MITETRTAYPQDAAPEIVEALNATGEVRARLSGRTTIEVSRKLSRGWQDMGRIEVDVDYDYDGNESLVLTEIPVRRRAWVQKIATAVIERHNAAD